MHKRPDTVTPADNFQAFKENTHGVCRLKNLQIFSCGTLLQPAAPRKRREHSPSIVNFVTTINFSFFLLYFMEHLNGYAVKHNVASGIPTSITCYTLSFVAARYRPLSVPGTFFIPSSSAHTAAKKPPEELASSGGSVYGHSQALLERISSVQFRLADFFTNRLTDYVQCGNERNADQGCKQHSGECRNTDCRTASRTCTGCDHHREHTDQE